MQFTTQKQQLKEHRQAVKAERLALCKRAFKAVAEYGLCFLIIITPALSVALGWIKD